MTRMVTSVVPRVMTPNARASLTTSRCVSSVAAAAAAAAAAVTACAATTRARERVM